MLASAGVAFLIAAAVLHFVSEPRDPPDFGSVPEAVAAPAPSGAARPSSATGVAPAAAPQQNGGSGQGSGSGSRGGSGSGSGSGSGGRRNAQAAGSGSVKVPAGRLAPVRLSLAGRNAAPVIGVGDHGGALDVPAAVSTLGWWVYGAGLESASGSVVIVGHVDATGQGTGYLSALRDVKEGQDVTVTAADGSVRHFAIAGRRTYRKKTGLPGTVFDQSVQRRLVLITCTGAFDPVARRYEDNLVVYALPR